MHKVDLISVSYQAVQAAACACFCVVLPLCCRECKAGCLISARLVSSRGSSCLTSHIVVLACSGVGWCTAPAGRYWSFISTTCTPLLIILGMHHPDCHLASDFYRLFAGCPLCATWAASFCRRHGLCICTYYKAVWQADTAQLVARTIMLFACPWFGLHGSSLHAGKSGLLAVYQFCASRLLVCHVMSLGR